MEYGDASPWEKAREGETDWVIVGGEEQHPPIKEKRTVYMVDFSLKPEDMKRLAEVSNLIWIDHHRTAIDAMCVPDGPEFSRYHCRSDKAACELCWEFTGGPTESIPEAVRLLGAYDSWRKDDPEWDSKIMPFQYGCRAIDGIYDPRCKVWYNLFTHAKPDADGTVWLNLASGAECNPSCSIGMLVWQGDAILNFQSQQNRKIAEAGAFEATLRIPRPDIEAKFRERLAEAAKDPVAVAMEHPGPHSLVLPQAAGIRCICLNTPLFSSQSFEGVWDPEKHDVMVAFALMATGKWKVSLYTDKPTINCGGIAKTFGGGGHAGAAGFVCDKLPWEAHQ